MPGLPLQHLRRSIAQVAATPEAHALIFAGTGLTSEDVADSGFVLTPELFWQLCDNVRTAYGPGWYLGLPALWSFEVHGQIETALRFAPNLAAGLAVAVDYGHVQWDVIRWHSHDTADGSWTTLSRNAAIDFPNWQMLAVLVVLNFKTIVDAAFPGLSALLIAEFEGPAPADEAWIEKMFGFKVSWNQSRCATFIPGPCMAMRSTLADANAFAAAIAGLESASKPAPMRTSTRVGNILGDRQLGRYTGAQVAGQLGITQRTLERNLASEGSSFRQLQEEALMKRFSKLIANHELSVAEIAERLGYSDESALSRASRRWLGMTAPQVRRKSVYPRTSPRAA